MTEEKTLWTGTPSQITHANYYIGMGLLSVFVIPLFMLVWRWLQTRATKYVLTTQRFRNRTGVFNHHTDELELYRIRDYQLIEPFWLRLFGLANVHLVTTDVSSPAVVLSGVKNGSDLLATIREHVEKARIARGVREIDVT